MCGIAGILNVHDTLPVYEREAVYAMLEVLKPRGPDESKAVSLGRATIGTCRLSIVDQELGGQPATSCCTPLSISFNGEIYNFRELKSSLRQEHHFQSSSDTEVLLHLFEEEGLSFLNRLNGMFAFCITDGEVAYLVRDRLGIKPLYYTFKASSLLFASEAKALISKTPQLYIEMTYDDFEANVGYETPFRGILELPPGSYLIFNMYSGQYTIRSYYSLGQSHNKQVSEKEAIDEIRWLVKDAIALRTNTHLPYGCFVSGGLDSTIIAQYARPGLLFSANVQDRLYMDESRYMHLLGESIDTELVVVRPSPEQFAQYFVEIVYALDFPTTTLAAFVQFLLSKAAAERHLRIMLSGIGADEYLGGYTRHVALLFAQPKKAVPHAYQTYTQLFDKLSGLADDLPAATRYSYLMSRSPLPTHEGLAIVRNLFEQHETVVNSMAATEMLLSFPSLLRTDDRINMHFGIESRAPFLDYRLIDFAFGVHDNLKIRQKADDEIVTKYILREAFKDEIPPLIAKRHDKVGFPSPVTLWLRDYFPSMVHSAREILTHIPELARLFPEDVITNRNEFSRKSWQLVQWAAWYLLFCQHLSISETTTLLFDRGSAVRRNN